MSGMLNFLRFAKLYFGSDASISSSSFFTNWGFYFSAAESGSTSVTIEVDELAKSRASSSILFSASLG